MMILSTLITGAVATVAVLSNAQTQNTSVNFDRQQAFYAAEAGVEQAIWNINHNATAFTAGISTPVNGTINGAKYTLTCITSHPSWPSTPLSFQSVGTSADKAVTSQASITITQNGSAPTLAMSGVDAFSGTVNVNGWFLTTGTFSGSGTVKLTTVSGQPAASLESTGAYSGSGTFNIPGNMIFNGNIAASGSLTVGGNVQTGGALTFSGASPTIGANVLATGNASISNTGTATIGGGVQVGGTTTMSGTNEITGSLQSTGVLSTTATSTIGGNLQAGGTSSATTATLSGTTTIAGNLLSTGKISASGTVKTTGNVQSGSTISHSGTWTVGGTTAINTPTSNPTAPTAPALSFTLPTVDTASLSAQAKASVTQYTATQFTSRTGLNNTLDFTTNPVIEITTPLSTSSTITVRGSGTLLVDGAMTISSVLGSAATPANVNIVTTGTFTDAANLYINGALCVGGSLIFSASSFNVTGALVIQNGITGSGNFNLTYAAPPSFVNWTGANIAGSSTITVSNFMGPMY